jgi:serine/threonine protein kinase
LDLFRKLADAVHYAHLRGVIHRDLKPSNILVSAGDPPQPKILDFGLARITEGDLALATLTSEVGLIKGTLPYMSPEQTRGDPEEIDVRADVYSLGVILYEMLSRRQPYDVMKKALGEAVRVICEQPPRPLGRSWSGAQARCRHRDDRRQSAAERGRPALRQRRGILRGRRSLPRLAADPGPPTERGLPPAQVRPAEPRAGRRRAGHVARPGRRGRRLHPVRAARGRAAAGGRQGP